MKKGLLFFALSLLFIGCTEPIDGETPVTKENLISNWGGNALTGAGSEPTNFGWTSSNTSAIWGVANSSVVGSTRYMDVSDASSPKHFNNDTVFVGRMLMYRWDGSYWASILSKPVTLAANTTYAFSWKYEWWANGTLPTFNVAVGTVADGTANIANKDFVANSTKNVLTEGTFTFTTTTAGSYYLIFKQNGLTSAEGALIGMTDLSLTKD